MGDETICFYSTCTAINIKDKVMNYAIIEAGGSQLRVEPGRFYDMNRLTTDDSKITIGHPFIEGATVEGIVTRERRGKKVIVYKMRPKKKTRKKRGHRQELSRLMINSISLNGSVICKSSPEASAEEKTRKRENEGRKRRKEEKEEKSQK